MWNICNWKNKYLFFVWFIYLIIVGYYEMEWYPTQEYVCHLRVEFKLLIVENWNMDFKLII